MADLEENKELLIAERKLLEQVKQELLQTFTKKKSQPEFMCKFKEQKEKKSKYVNRKLSAEELVVIKMAVSRSSFDDVELSEVQEKLSILLNKPDYFIVVYYRQKTKNTKKNKTKGEQK